MTGFHRTAAGYVEPQWIDANGHMNVMWYTALFDRGCEALQSAIGITPASIAAGEPTLVAARVLTAHRRELLQGDAWELWSGLAVVEPQHVTFMHRLIGNGVVRAICAIRSHAFCPRTRTRSELGAHTLERARSYLVPGLADPFALLHGVMQ